LEDEKAKETPSVEKEGSRQNQKMKKLKSENEKQNEKGKENG